MKYTTNSRKCQEHSKKTGTPFSDVPVLCLFLVAAARAAVGAVTAAGGFSFFLIFHQLNYDQGDNGKQYSRYGDCRNIGV